MQNTSVDLLIQSDYNQLLLYATLQQIQMNYLNSVDSNYVRHIFRRAIEVTFHSFHI